MTLIIWTIYILSFASILCVIRLIIGPTYYDRLIALNLLVTITTAIMVIWAVELERYIYLDVALVYAILGFVSIIAIVKYLTGKELHW